MPEGQVYRCQNRDCGCEISVVKRATESHCNPRCLCGAEMKKPYSRPLLAKSGRELQPFRMS